MYMRDNVLSADNQQERLIKIGWITGFVDGEGCFSVGFTRQPDRVNRRGYTTGWQVSHRFVVTQGAKSASALIELQQFFQVGRVTLNKRYDNHKEHLMQYLVNNRSDLLGTDRTVLSAISITIGQAARFREIRSLYAGRRKWRTRHL